MIDIPAPVEVRPVSEYVYAPVLLFNPSGPQLEQFLSTMPLPHRAHMRPEERPSHGAFTLQPGDRYRFFRQDIEKACSRGSLMTRSGMQGGFARVVVGQDVKFDRPVAAKILRGEKVYEQRILDAFYKEARILANIDHPNIVKTFDVTAFQTENRWIPAIIEEYLDGKPLSMQDEIPLNTLADVVDSIASGLDHVHTKGLIHGDVSLSNIVRTSSSAKLVDFGHVLGDYRHDTKQVVLSSTHIPYTAPEMFLSPPSVSPAADIHALGVAAFLAINRLTSPFSSPDGSPVEAHRRQEQGMVPLQPTKFVSDRRVLQKIDGVIQKATAFLPQDRFPTAGALAVAFRAAIS